MSWEDLESDVIVLSDVVNGEFDDDDFEDEEYEDGYEDEDDDEYEYEYEDGEDPDDDELEDVDEEEIEDDEEDGLVDRLRGERLDDGSARFGIPAALSVMVFIALCCQCASTLAVMARETSSWRWPVFAFVYMTALAWIGAFLTYRIGTGLGL